MPDIKKTVFNNEFFEMCAQGTRRIFEEGLSPSRGGDISLRDTSTGLIYVSAGLALFPFPFGNFSDVMMPDPAVFTIDGDVLCGDKLATNELPMHLAIYRARPDVNCVLHIHSMWPTMFAMCGQSVEGVPEDENRYDRFNSSQTVVCSDYAPAGALEVGESVAKVLGSNNAALIASHGAVAVGASMDEAFMNARLLEESSQKLIYEKILLGGKHNGIRNR